MDQQNMDPIIQSLYDRKSVRAFEDRPVPEAVKQAVLGAACQAPTAGNQQLYTILDITDPALKQALSVTCDNQPFIATAPVVLVFCADCKKWYDAYRAAGCDPRAPGVGDLLLAVTDTAIAAQNAVVAAHALGLGSCYIGDILENCRDQRRLLRLPEYVLPAVMLVMGWPTEQQRSRPKPRRCPQEYIVHENGYRPLSPEDLRAMLRDRAGKLPYETWCANFCRRKYNSDFSREMTRSVAEYLRQFEPKETGGPSHEP